MGFWNGSLRRKVIISMLGVGLFSLGLGLLVTYIMGINELSKTIGASFKGLAGEAAHKTDLIIAKELGEVTHIASSSDLIKAIDASNRGYQGLTPIGIEDRLKAGEARWNTEKALGIQPKGILINEGSKYLMESTQLEKKEKINIALFVTDKMGALVASINGYPRYRHSDEEWWIKTYNRGEGRIYLSDIYFDDIAKTYAWELAVPVTSKDNIEVLGILKVVLSVQEFFQPAIFSIRFGNTGHAMLIDSEGRVIICPVLPTGSHVADIGLLKVVTAPHSGWARVDNDAHGGRNSIIGFAPVDEVNLIFRGSGGKNWYSFIRQDPKELYRPLYTMLRNVVIYGIILGGIIIAVGIILSERLVKPIKALQEGAEVIGKGDLNHRLAITTKDEIGVLGGKFNEMAEKLKRSYLNLENSLERLKEMDKFKSEFISLISHELRTPLTSIIGFSELLVDRIPGELNRDQEEYIRNIQSSGQQLLEIINNLLDISKLRAGKLELTLGDFDVKHLISEVLGSMAPLISRKGLSLEDWVEEGIPMIHADRAKIKQTLLNFISNAIKFTPKGGNIIVDVRGTVINSRAMLQVSVTDTGIGIKAEDRERIFEEFRQVDSTYARDYPGTGLGLSIARRFVEMHEGSISVNSRPGEGSTFTFCIPVRMEREEPSPAPSAETREVVKPTIGVVEERHIKEERPLVEDTERPQILIVEDDIKTSRLLGLYLTQDGYRVIYAYDGEEAIERAKEHRPFAITLDIMLPKKDGWEVLRELKNLPETKEIPVIIVSMISDMDMGFFLGAADYLTKPIDKKRLLESLRAKSFTKKVKRKPVNILAIDDDPQILRLLESILEAEGFGVIKSTRGEEGYNMAVEIQPDLIILDLLMPGVNGFEILKMLKEHPTAKGIPVIVFTAKELTPEDKDLLNGKIMEVVRKGGSLKNNLINEVRRFEKLYPDKGGMVDGLTGLYNERYLRLRLNEEAARYNRFKRPFSLILINIDGFKHYNSANGTEEGDKVLREMTDVLRRNTRTQNPLCRCGGSTFGIILTETSIDTANQVAEKLRRIVEGYPFHKKETQPAGNITIGAGVSSFYDDTGTAEKLITKADKALEDARRSGGNTVKRAV